jgi:predicted nucleic acid-binding protein
VNKLKTELDAGNQVVIPPIVYYEVRRGLLASNAIKKADAFESLFVGLNIDAIDRETLEMAAAEYARLRKAGLTIGDADLFIAEFCIKNDFALVTDNTKHFSAIKGLRYTNWIK